MLLISSAPLAVQICSFPKEHGLKNWQQTRYTICVWRRLGVRHKRLGVVKGVGRRASSRRLKNIASRILKNTKDQIFFAHVLYICIIWCYLSFVT